MDQAHVQIQDRSLQRFLPYIVVQRNPRPRFCAVFLFPVLGEWPAWGTHWRYVSKANEIMEKVAAILKLPSRNVRRRTF